MHCSLRSYHLVPVIVITAISGLKTTSFPLVRETVKFSSASEMPSSKPVKLTQFLDVSGSKVSVVVTVL